MLSAQKVYNLHCHYKILHKDKFGVPEGKLTEDKMKCDLQQQYNIYNNHGSTALYGLRPPLSEVTGSCAFVTVGDWPTGRAAVLSILM